MSATYEKTFQLDSIIETLLEEKPYHSDLRTAGITVQVLMYHSEGPLQHRGANAYAYVKGTSLKERALGQKDATIVVDAGPWKNMGERNRIALVDHELYHLTIKKDKDMAPEFDDLGRPKIKLRKHDVEVGWFVQIAQEHQRDSIECFQAAQLLQRHKQTLFAFAIEDPDQALFGKLKKAVDKAVSNAKTTCCPTPFEQDIRAGRVTITAD